MSADKDERLPVKLSLPLSYQQDLFHELRSEDELVVLARGLGLLRIVSNLLHSYDAAGGNLIVIVGATDRENGWIGEALAEHAAVSASPLARGLSVVNTDVTNVGMREKMYARGGVFSVTSRILVVDLLTSMDPLFLLQEATLMFVSDLLNPETLTGIIVLHAEKVIATSLEAFILRIYRQRNKIGFLKAFSDSPEPFTMGFSPLAKMMRNLFLLKPSLWPRFHLTVKEALEGEKKADVIEFEIPMTDAMRDIQNAVLECVEVSMRELKKANTGLEMDDWNVDSALHKSFDVIVRRQLDPEWHRVSWKTKQIVNDLTVLRGMLQSVLSYDAVSLRRHLETILAAHAPPPGSTRQTQSPWLFLDAAHTIFDTAKRRVYTGTSEEAGTLHGLPDGLRPVLEEQPKWACLAEILEEIERDVYFNPTIRDDSNGTILVMCGDESTCRQLREYLQTMHVRPDDHEGDESGREGKQDMKPSAAYMMRRKLRNYLNWKKDFAKVSASLFAENQKALNGSTDLRRGGESYRGKPPPNKRRRVRGGSAAASGPSRVTNGSIQITEDQASHVAELLAEVRPTRAEANQKHEIAADPLEDMEDYYELYEMNDLVIIHPYDGDMDEHVLEELKPRYIIMYEPDTAFPRRVEVYRSSHRYRNVKVFLMCYTGSVEEQRYFSAVRKEKDAFTKLIKEKGAMSITIALDRSVEDPQEKFLRTVNTRIAGGGRLAATAEPPRVVVDVREFRSSLPSLLHGRSVVIVPCMLTVGDYILSPDICVERKSIKDLISSFKDGRLYSQAETMGLHYKNPMLLIEFDQNKSFTLEPFADLSGSTTQQDLQSKLVLLTLAFPRLKIIWSSSPYQTAEIFEELKKNQDEPDPIKAVSIGLADGEDPTDQTFNQTPREMLQKVPGVNAKVARALVLEVESILELSNMEEGEVSGLVGGEVGRQVHRFFNRSVFDD
ncbi:MAG: hypothetical protein M1839_006924 [Geoglossum umbratile]|nr:MAG: hypothetical protein M1839_006924 [Geoglossum umbratile]